MYDQDEMYGEFRQRNTMASAAIVLGVLSLLSCAIFYISIPCGALAVLCAILSRGRFKLTGIGRAGILCGIIGMAASAVITAASVRAVLTDPDKRAQLEQVIQMYLGDYSFDLDETLNSLIPAFGNTGNADSLPFAAETEEETEDETERRVRLRVAADTAQTEADGDMEETAADPSEKEAPEKADETEENHAGAQTPAPLPEGGKFL